MIEKWNEWGQKLAGIAQSGLYYTDSEYERERYESVRQVAAEMMNCEIELAQEAAAFLDDERGYATPKLDTRGAAFRDDKILLVKEMVDGKWTLPGGWADVGLSPSENIEREVFEESGFKAKATRLVAVYDRNKHAHKPAYPFQIYKMFFLCEIAGGEAKTCYETTDVGFFAEDAIPELSISRVLPEQIAMMFEYYRNPQMPVYFD